MQHWISTCDQTPLHSFFEQEHKAGNTVYSSSLFTLLSWDTQSLSCKPCTASWEYRKCSVGVDLHSAMAQSVLTEVSNDLENAQQVRFWFGHGNVSLTVCECVADVNSYVSLSAQEFAKIWMRIWPPLLPELLRTALSSFPTSPCTLS